VCRFANTSIVAAMLVEVPVGVPDTWLEFALSPPAFTAETT
jgi:hypothetical protein